MNVQKVSIIVPVYNVEKYLEECVDSITAQDVGFEDRVELILVNDGSKDSSGLICERYAERYPDNVVYVSQKNAGASEARNNGVQRATGELVGFIDADDYITHDVVRAAVEYFESASDDVDIAISRVVQFGSKNRERPINKKFYFGTRTADLNDAQWYDVNPRVAPAFIRATAAKRHRFQKDVRFYEDTRYVSDIVAENMKMGVLARGVYYNRMHDAQDTEASITTGATSERRYYMDSPEKVSLYLLKKYKDEQGVPLLYFQYLVMYEMRWRMFYNPNSAADVLSKTDFAAYRETNREILNLLTNEAIVGNKLYDVRQRAYLMSLKHGKDILEEAEFADDDRLFWRGLIVFNHMTKMSARITQIDVRDGVLELQGFFLGFFVKGFSIFPRIDGKDSPDSMTLTDDGATMAITDDYDENRYKRHSFVVKMPIDDGTIHELDFNFMINDHRYILKYIDPALLFEDMPRLPRYSQIDDYIVAWYGHKLRVVTSRKPLAAAVVKGGSTLSYMLKYGRRGLRKIKRLCIRMIKTLR